MWRECENYNVEVQHILNLVLILFGMLVVFLNHLITMKMAIGQKDEFDLRIKNYILIQQRFLTLTHNLQAGFTAINITSVLKKWGKSTNPKKF